MRDVFRPGFGFPNDLPQDASGTSSADGSASGARPSADKRAALAGGAAGAGVAPAGPGGAWGSASPGPLIAELEQLGADVFNTLTRAGHAPFRPGSDGFVVLADPGTPGEVAVVLDRSGPLYGCPAAGIHRAYFCRYERTLTAAGYATRRVERDGFPVLLYVSPAVGGAA